MSFFYEGVPTGRLLILQWMAPHSCTYGQHQLDRLSGLLKTKTHEVVRGTY